MKTPKLIPPGTSLKVFVVDSQGIVVVQTKKP